MGGAPRRCVALGCLALVALASAPACQPAPPAAPAPRRIRYDGATSISRRIFPTALPALAQRSGVSVEVLQSGTGKGLKALFASQVDVAGVSRALTPEERALRPSVAIIGYDALAVWVHASNPVKGLSHAQLKDLFTGKVTNWKDVGGRDLPVVTCTERRASERATLEAFRQLALDGAPYGPGRELEDPADCLKLVGAEPGGVVAASMALGGPTLRAVPVEGVVPLPANVRNASYPLTRPLLLVTRGPPEGAVRELVEYFTSPEGQAAVAGAGFVAAR